MNNVNEKTRKTVRLAVGSTIGVMTVIFGALCLWQVLEAYFTGKSSGGKFIFAQSDMFARFSRVSPAFWLWIILIAAGFVIWEVFPVSPKKTAYKDPRYALARLKKRIPATVGEELNDNLAYIKREQKLLNILWICCAALGFAGFVYTVVYLAIPSNFPKEDVTHEMLNMVKNVFPWVTLTFITACGITFYEGKSAKRQLERARKLAAGNPLNAPAHGRLYAILHSEKTLFWFRIGFGCLAVTFIILGSALFDEVGLNNMKHILIKAANICSECIGLG